MLRFTIPDLPNPDAKRPEDLAEQFRATPGTLVGANAGIVAWGHLQGQRAFGFYNYHDMEYSAKHRCWVLKPGVMALALLALPEGGIEALPVGYEGQAAFYNGEPGIWVLESKQIRPW